MADLSRSSVGRWVSVSLATLTFAGLAGAMDPNRAWSQYTRDRWSLEQGFPGGSIYAITETADGYLWIGAEKGLVRFDGLNFRLFNHATTATLPEGPVLDLAASADGDLWLRMQVPSVVRYHAGIFEDVSQTLGQIDNPVTAIFRRDNGDLLLAAIDNKILKYGSGRLTRREFTTQHPNFFVDSLAETGDGTLWLGTRDSGLFSMSKAGASPVPQGLHERRINSLLRNGEQELWIGSDGGLVRWDGTRTTDEGVAEALKHVQILSMTRDRDANIWVGTAKGLARISSSGATSLDDRAAMPVMAVFEDREGNLWSGGTQGIERFRDSLFLTYSTATSRPENNGPLYVDEAGRTWFAPSDGGLYWLKGTEIKPVAIAGLNHDLVYSIAGSGGELWVARQRGGLTHLVEGHGSFRATTYTRKDGLAQDTVYTVYRSRDGSVWAGTLSSGVSRLRNGRFTTYTTANGLASDSISSILEGTDGTMWFATANGLNAFSGDRWLVYAGGQGLPSGHLNCLLEDSNGVL